MLTIRLHYVPTGDIRETDDNIPDAPDDPEHALTVALRLVPALVDAIAHAQRAHESTQMEVRIDVWTVCRRCERLIGHDEPIEFTDDGAEVHAVCPQVAQSTCDCQTCSHLRSIRGQKAEGDR